MSTDELAAALKASLEAATGDLYVEAPLLWLNLSEQQRSKYTRLAQLIAKSERDRVLVLARRLARICTTAPTVPDQAVTSYIDWRALDAEIAKENEDG